MQSNPEIHTADPEIGARQLSKMPTMQCTNCDTYYWDSQASENLKQITRNNKMGDVKRVVAGSTCPECNHVQHEDYINETI